MSFLKITWRDIATMMLAIIGLTILFYIVEGVLILPEAHKLYHQIYIEKEIKNLEDLSGFVLFMELRWLIAFVVAWLIVCIVALIKRVRIMDIIVSSLLGVIFYLIVNFFE